MSGALRNLITTSIRRSGLGGDKEMSTTDQGARSLEEGVKYGSAATPSPSPTAGGVDEEPAMRARAGSRRDSSGGVWRRRGGRVEMAMGTHNPTTQRFLPDKEAGMGRVLHPRVC